MSKAKTVIKAGVGAAAAVMGLGAIVYECALNTKLNGFFVNLFDKRPDPTEFAPKKDVPEPAGEDWFEAHKGDDKVISAEATGRIHAYIIPSEGPSHKWAVLCHGYNASPKATDRFAKHYHELGYSCICPSLRGWGNDETRYCTMGYHDKDILMAWIDYIVCMDPDAQIVIHGYSMGAVTVMLATGEALPAQVKAAVADCGFTSCWEQYANVIKLYAKLPAFPLLHAVNAVSILRGNFDIRKNVPIDAVRRSVTPTVFLHGTADDFVPFPMMERLYEACAAPKTMQAIEGADHAQAVFTDPKLYWKTVDEFLKDKITCS
ncbi:MAG: alpha/beta hydrolase [Clostridia bacterium]|nr:alpha/beta hydrolase [Clostridia bacterium]